MVNVSNPDLQEWLRLNCRPCREHDKRRKKDNAEFIAKFVTTAWDSLNQDNFKFSTAPFMSDEDLHQLNQTSKSTRMRTDDILKSRRVYGPEVFKWSPLERMVVRHMHTEDFNGLLSKDMLPPGLTHLTFGHKFNQPLGPGVLPPHLTHLKFGWNFNQPLGPGVLPPDLTHLKFGYNVYNRPTGLSDFDQPLEVGVLPPSLTHLTFGNIFNQPLGLDVLPPRLTHLKFVSRSEFNQPLGLGVLPRDLTNLKFGWDFNQPLGLGVLPPDLTHLKFGWSFNQTLGPGVA